MAYEQPAYKEIVKGCLERWVTNDEKTIFFEENFNEWIEQIPSEIVLVILQMLERFDYYTHQTVNYYLRSLHHELIACDKFSEEKTIFTFLPSEKGISNSSLDYWFEYKYIHHLRKYDCVMDINKYSTVKLASIDNIVIIDDFCGSGKSLIKFIISNKDNLSGKKIYYILIHVMSESLPRFEEIQKEYNISISVISAKTSSRIFDSLEYIKDADHFRKTIKDQSYLLGINGKYALGFDNTEALVSFFNDTPNNTIGLFWNSTKTYFSIFPRDFKDDTGLMKPRLQQMRDSKRTRNAQNYYSKMRRV